MRFSICAPVYNVEKFLKECVFSILNQSFTDFEVIFVNDGSTDGSLSLLQELCKNDSRVKIICKQNAGLLWARRDAIRIAAGEYVLFIDSDDKYSDLHFLEELDKYIQKYNQPDLLLFNRSEFSDASTAVQSRCYFNDEILFENETLKRIRYEFITRNYFNAMFLKCVKRNVLNLDNTDYTKYNPQMAEDITQSIFIFNKSEKVVFIPKIYYLYRINPNSITNAPLTIQTLEKKMVRGLFSELLNYIKTWELQKYKNNVYQKFYKKVYGFYFDRFVDLTKNGLSDLLISEILSFNWFNEENKVFENTSLLKQSDLNRYQKLVLKGLIMKDKQLVLKGYKLFGKTIRKPHFIRKLFSAIKG